MKPYTYIVYNIYIYIIYKYTPHTNTFKEAYISRREKNTQECESNLKRDGLRNVKTERYRDNNDIIKKYIDVGIIADYRINCWSGRSNRTSF